MRKGIRFKSIKTRIMVGFVGMVAVVCVGLALVAYCVAARELRLHIDESTREIIEQAISQMGNKIALVSALFIVVGAVIGYLVARQISKPLKIAVAHLGREVAVGNLEHDAAPEVLARADELGELAAAIQNIIDDQRQKAAVARQIANGDLQVQLQLKSEQDVLTKNLIEMTANLQQLITDIDTVAEAAQDGHWSMRVDATKHNGDYQKIVNGINATLDAVIRPAEAMQHVLKKIAVNDYTEELQPEQYQGHFQELAALINEVRLHLLHLQEVAEQVARGNTGWLEEFKQIGRHSEQDRLLPAFILMMQNIEALIGEVDHLAQAAVRGDLHHRGDAAQFEGGYQKIINGFNRVLDASVEPINETSTVLQDLATGNLNVAVRGDYQGDHAVLTQALNHTIDSFNDVMLNIANTADQVATGSQQVANISQMTSQTASEQTATTEEMNASLEEIALQTKQNAEKALKANQLAVTAQKQATDGNEQMQQMLEAMNMINDSSANISKIIKVIEEIAFQTNILALNAAVEAARAGQYGKGFAVVAEEVRNLATRSAEAAKETNILIKDSIQKVATGSQIANATAQSFSIIMADIAQTTVLAGDIASASNEQAQAMVQVNQGMEQIAQVSQNGTATAQESAAASEELAAQAELLEKMVERFKLKASGKPNVGKQPQIGQSKAKAAGSKRLILDSGEFGKY